MSEIKQYSEVEAKISEISKNYSVVPDVSTGGGLKLCKKQYKEVRKYEIDLEKKRKSLGEDARNHLTLINGEAKRIDGLLVEISAPFKNALEGRELEIEQAEENRIKGIRDQINQVHGFIQDAQGQNPDGISAIIEALDKYYEQFHAESLLPRPKSTLAFCALRHLALNHQFLLL